MAILPLMRREIFVGFPGKSYKTKILKIFSKIIIVSINYGLDKIPNLRTISMFMDLLLAQNRTFHWRKDLSGGGFVCSG